MEPALLDFEDIKPVSSYADLGPPIAMQSALRSHVTELMKNRESFRALMEKFKLATALHEEKEARSTASNDDLQNQIGRLEATVQNLTDINDKYKTALIAQNSAKEVFQAKVREIATTIELLQQREDRTNEINKELVRERDLLQGEINRLKERFEFESTRDAEYEKKRRESEELAEKDKNALAAKSAALVAQEHQDEIQALVSSNAIRIREMEQRIKDEYVLRSEYQQLQGLYDVVCTDKQILEESIHIVDCTHREADRRAEDAERSLGACRAKLHESEKAALQAQLGEERALRDLSESKEEVERSLKVQALNEERLLTLEREKSMLLTQVASLKFDATRAHSSLTDSKKKIALLESSAAEAAPSSSNSSSLGVIITPSTPTRGVMRTSTSTSTSTPLSLPSGGGSAAAAAVKQTPPTTGGRALSAEDLSIIK
jgi:hypothetical protein